MVKETKLYDLLGVGTNADLPTLKRAYHQAALDYHPDKNPGVGSDKFQELSGAYEILRDKDLRKDYDQNGTRNGSRTTSATSPEAARKVYESMRAGLSREEIEVDEKTSRLIAHWSDDKILEKSINERFGLAENGTYCDRVDVFLDNGRLLHSFNQPEDKTKRDKRRSTAYKALIQTSQDAKIFQAYRDLLKKWDGNDAFDGRISNGKYLDENGKEIQGPSKEPTQAQPLTAVTQICDRYQDDFKRFCQNIEATAMQALVEKLNSELAAEWKKIPEMATAALPDWNEIGRRLETAKAVRKHRDGVTQHTGQLTANGQQQVNPEYSWWYSTVEQAKNQFLVDAKRFGFPDYYGGTFSDAIETFESTDPSLVNSVEGYTASGGQGATQENPADGMEGVEFTGPVGEPTSQNFQVYDHERGTSDPVWAWVQRTEKVRQILVRKTPINAKVAVYQLLSAKTYEEECDSFIESGGLDLTKHKGSAEELKGRKRAEFDLKAVFYVPRKSLEPLIGWARWPEMHGYGRLAGRDEDKFYTRTDLRRGLNFDYLRKFNEHIAGANILPLEPPRRKELAHQGRLALENRLPQGALLRGQSHQMSGEDHVKQLRMAQERASISGVQPETGTHEQKMLKDLESMSLGDIKAELVSRRRDAMPGGSMMDGIANPPASAQMISV